MTTPLPLPLAHVGLLVGDLETARQRWSTVTGFPFSPISRYQPETWSDLVTPEPHPQSARLTFCFGDAPSFEILEFVGVGTHSPEKGEGGHHLSFPPVDDLPARREELARLGIGTDGSIEHEGELIFLFGEAGPVDNVYTEWVFEHPAHADVKDDGSPVNRRADGSKTLFDLETIDAVDGVRPFSGVTEVEVTVDSLPRAVALWSALTGYEFPDLRPAATTTLSTPVGTTALRLTERRDASERLGVHAATITTDDLEGVRIRLARDAVPVLAADDDGIAVDPAYLNGFTIRFAPAAV